VLGKRGSKKREMGESLVGGWGNKSFGSAIPGKRTRNTKGVGEKKGASDRVVFLLKRKERSLVKSLRCN